MSSLPLGPHVTIAGQHPCGLWALNKPCGVRSHPNSARTDSQALLAAPYDLRTEAYFDPTSDRRWHLLNRLDGPTSGLILIAESEEVAHRVRALFAQQTVRKTYFALVMGRPRSGQERWEDRLQIKKGPEGARVMRGGNQLSITEMRLVESAKGAGLSLLELRPLTGRTHQLRVQCAARQLPIVGDATYGDFRFNRAFAARTDEKRLFLHAARISLQFELNNQKVGFRASAKLPESFTTALAAEASLAGKRPRHGQSR